MDTKLLALNEKLMDIERVDSIVEIFQNYKEILNLANSTIDDLISNLDSNMFTRLILLYGLRKNKTYDDRDREDLVYNPPESLLGTDFILSLERELLRRLSLLRNEPFLGSEIDLKDHHSYHYDVLPYFHCPPDHEMRHRKEHQNRIEQS